MADIFELMLSVDLCDEVSEEELAELRWHLGLGPQPEVLRIVTDFPFVAEDEHGEPVVENCPEPLLAQRGEACKVQGEAVSVLARKQDTQCAAWALVSRQEIHPEDFERTGELLTWLAHRAGDPHRRPDGGVALGWTRFHEETEHEVLVVSDGAVGWPS
ncbi:hypothetical protein ACFYVL_38740 [Streptomyces sp. NPDC004111]|uniref:hypothetical protein n=1 Tax=Streptomyces sp. NPDC004111 TaxID=3364690 RepID=UPI0036958A58